MDIVFTAGQGSECTGWAKRGLDPHHPGQADVLLRATSRLGHHCAQATAHRHEEFRQDDEAGLGAFVI